MCIDKLLKLIDYMWNGDAVYSGGATIGAGVALCHPCREAGVALPPLKFETYLKRTNRYAYP